MNSRTYLVDKTEKFDGIVQTSCTNGYADYQDEPITTADYIEKKKAEGLDLIELTWEELSKKLEDYNNKTYLSKPWKEITEEQFFDAFECLPPLKLTHIKNAAGEYKSFLFFISEATTADIHATYINYNGEKFYSASRSIFQRPIDLFCQLKNQLGEL